MKAEYDFSQGRRGRLCVQVLTRNTQAKQFFSTLSKANLFAIAYHLQTARRPETKAKRIKPIIDRLARGETCH